VARCLVWTLQTDPAELHEQKSQIWQGPNAQFHDNFTAVYDESCTIDPVVRFNINFLCLIVFRSVTTERIMMSYFLKTSHILKCVLLAEAPFKPGLFSF
jgi:hypothetical protein